MAEQTHSFGYWLRRRRKALDLTQEQLAQAVSCSHFAIRKIEADERRPSRALAGRLAERLAVPAAERAAFLARARGVRPNPVADSRSVPAVRESDPEDASSAQTVAVPDDRSPQTGASDPDGTGGATRSSFVGRTAELRVIDQALLDVIGGSGRFIAVAGQPGIGKTSLARETARRAALAGLDVCWGRAIEDAGAPPYWPWVQLLRERLESMTPETAAQAMAGGACWIAEVVPEAAEPAGEDHAPAAHAADPAQARFRFFDATATFLRRSSAQRPVALILDDLHSADPASLRLLAFVAAEAAASRVLIVGTYRDVGVDRRHPLLETLGQCARAPGFVRIDLHGLTRDETRDLVTMLRGPADDAPGLFERTEGHPLFLAQLARAAAADRIDGPPRLPAGIREAIGSRLNRLDADCNRALAVAAVIGRDFEFGVLVRSVDDLGAEGCITALEQALAAQVVVEERDADLYRFSHSLIREVLYEEISGPRRQRLHQRVAEVLETAGGGDPSRIAYHYAASSPGLAAPKALEYARRAGEQAMRLLAFEDAVRQLRFARSLFESMVNADRSGRLALELDLGDAEIAAGEYDRARDSFRRAIDMARDVQDGIGMARGAIGFEEASWRPGWSGEPSVALLEEALAVTSDAADRDRARLLASLTRALIFSGAGEAANLRYEAAISAARRSGDDATLADALCSGLSARWLPDRLGTRLAAAQEAMLISRRTDDRDRWLGAAPWQLFDLLELGDTESFTAAQVALVREAGESRQPFWIYTAASCGPALALMRGELDASEHAAGELLRLGSRLPGLDARGVHATQMFGIRREQGRLAELAPLVRHFVAITPQAATWRPGLALVFAEVGLLEDAWREFDRLAADGFAGVARDGMWVASMCYLAEVCVALGDEVQAGRIASLLRPYQHRNLLAGTAVACFGAGSRVLGMLATAARRWDDAERDFEHALAMNTRQGARLWVAHTQAAYATMLGARSAPGDRERAAKLADEARRTATALGLARVEATLAATPALARPGAVR